MRAIEAFEDYTDPVQQALNICELVNLTPAQGGLGVPNLKIEAPLQYAALKLFTKHHVKLIKCQSAEMGTSEQSIDDLKRIQQ